jgi:hypothetical protein
VGYGLTSINYFTKHAGALGIGNDAFALAGSADMFAVMRLLRSVETGSDQDELVVAPRICSGWRRSKARAAWGWRISSARSRRASAPTSF